MKRSARELKATQGKLRQWQGATLKKNSFFYSLRDNRRSLSLMNYSTNRLGPQNIVENSVRMVLPTAAAPVWDWFDR